MLKIRLQRVGRKHETSFRIVLVDSRRASKSGAFLEILGSYDPRKNNDPRLKQERIAHWIAQGAQISGTVHNLLVDHKIVSGPKRNVSPAQKQKQKQEHGTATVAPSPAAGTPAKKDETGAPKEVGKTKKAPEPKTPETASDMPPEQPEEPAASPQDAM